MLLSQRWGIVHISTGDIFRRAIREQTAEGKVAQPYIAKGQLVPDEVVNDIVASRFRSEDVPREFILDGYPRTAPQARNLDVVLKENHLGLDGVIFLDVDDKEIIKRLAGRWNCPNTACLETFNTFQKIPAVAGVCDSCGSKLIQREDDREDTVRQRLEVFHQVNDALLAHYENQKLLVRVSGKGDIGTIYQDLEKKLSARKSAARET